MKSISVGDFRKWLGRDAGQGFIRGAAAVALGWALHYVTIMNAPIVAPVPIPVTARAPAPASVFPLLDSLRADSGFVALVDRTLRAEGFRSHVYDDGRGNQTIGYGLNLDAGISEGLGRVIAEYKLAEAYQGFRSTWSPFNGEPPPVQFGLTGMAYQLGVTGAERFTDMLDAVQDGDVSRAVREIRNSDWYDETQSRAEDLIRILRGAL